MNLIDETSEDLLAEQFIASARKSKCELRPGIGLCDDCGLPKWPQEYVGYGAMVCLDCLTK